MREESHLDEMRSAIRGDFERLAERRGEQDLMRVADVDDAELEPAPDVEEEQDSAPEGAVAAEAQSEPEDAEPRRSWLARFLSP